MVGAFTPSARHLETWGPAGSGIFASGSSPGCQDVLRSSPDTHAELHRRGFRDRGSSWRCAPVHPSPLWKPYRWFTGSGLYFRPVWHELGWARDGTQRHRGRGNGRGFRPGVSGCPGGGPRADVAQLPGSSSRYAEFGPAAHRSHLAVATALQQRQRRLCLNAERHRRRAGAPAAPAGGDLWASVRRPALSGFGNKRRTAPSPAGASGRLFGVYRRQTSHAGQNCVLLGF
jgi:hypothetical protein